MPPAGSDDPTKGFQLLLRLLIILLAVAIILTVLLSALTYGG